MGFFSSRQNLPTWPNDIADKVERFGRYKFNPQISGVDPADIGQLRADLYQITSIDHEGFLVALAWEHF